MKIVADGASQGCIPSSETFDSCEYCEEIEHSLQSVELLTQRQYLLHLCKSGIDMNFCIFARLTD